MISKTPFLIRKFYKNLVWNIPTEKKEVFLSFDDGPTPGVTEKVLEILKAYSAKATFFCIGNNVQKYPSLFQNILDEGHAVGNHTHNHLNGWKNTTESYLQDVSKCEKIFKTELFRPPYGKIQHSQIRSLKDRFKIVMWTVISRDYDRKISRDACLKLALSGMKAGSIIVFHDSKKAESKLFYALEGLLMAMKENGYSSSIIESRGLQ